MKKLISVLAILLLTTAGCSEMLNDPVSESNNNTATIGSLAKGSPTPTVPTMPTTGNGGPTIVQPGITPCGTPKVVDFWAGQYTDAGSVTIYNDNTNLYVTVFSEFGFQSGTEQIKMWVGADFTTIDGGGTSRPSAGGFPYKINTDGGTTYTFTISLDDLQLVNKCGDMIYVVVHGDVLVSDGNGGTKGETAFGGDIPGGGNAWWFYTTYTIACCSDTPPPVLDHSETAFAKGVYDQGGYVFTTDNKSNPEGLPSLKLSKNRWGWAINLKTDGETTYDIWAGAGLNNTTKNGTKVGTLTVIKNTNADDVSTVTVTYLLFSGKTMQEAHIYISDLKPTTVAPGQYGNTTYFDPMVSTYTASFTVSDTNGDGIWIIAHAVVNW